MGRHAALKRHVTATCSVLAIWAYLSFAEEEIDAAILAG
jgi:hypothetical protein